MSRPRTAAAILAGGRARRLGGLDKSRLLVGGRPIIVRQVAVLQTVADDVFIVAGDAERFRDLGLAVHADRIDGAGALGGLYTALLATPADRVIVVACDLPFLDAGLLQALSDRTAGHDGAWVRTADGVEPLLACYQREAHTRIRTAIDAGRYRARDLEEVLRMATLGPEELAGYGPVERLLANVNTPDDYARVQ